MEHAHEDSELLKELENECLELRERMAHWQAESEKLANSNRQETTQLESTFLQSSQKPQASHQTKDLTSGIGQSPSPPPKSHKLAITSGQESSQARATSLQPEGSQFDSKIQSAILSQGSQSMDDLPSGSGQYLAHLTNSTFKHFLPPKSEKLARWGSSQTTYTEYQFQSNPVHRKQTNSDSDDSIVIA